MSGTETSFRSSATTDMPSQKPWKMLLASLLFSPCLLSCFEKLNCTRHFSPTALGVCQSSRHCKMDVSLDSSTFLKFFSPRCSSSCALPYSSSSAFISLSVLSSCSCVSHPFCLRCLIGSVPGNLFGLPWGQCACVAHPRDKAGQYY